MTAPAHLLDLTRLVSRAGRTLTGVDRVERAWAAEIAGRPEPAFGLVRTALGYVLVGRGGIAAILEAAKTGDWGRRDILSRLSRRLDPGRQAGQAFVRRHALARAVPQGLGRLLVRHLPPGTVYLNTGHANLTDRVLQAVRQIPQSRIAVLIHDTIPLDFPDFQREGTVPVFAAKLARVGKEADLIFCPSGQAAADVRRHLGGGSRPDILPAPLGVTLAAPDSGGLPPQIDRGDAYFVALGTIEPRKNHALLLDAWDMLGSDAPMLYLCGNRGWRNEAVFARLDRGNARIRELPGLDDGAVAALLSGARALLFPSLAEGFGLPPVEALAMGTPVIASPLAVLKEILGDSAVYLPPDAPYLWAAEVQSRAGRPREQAPAFAAPTWSEHFKIVLNAAC